MVNANGLVAQIIVLSLSKIFIFAGSDFVKRISHPNRLTFLLAFFALALSIA